MGVFRQKVKLINTADILVSEAGYLEKANVRELEADMLVDTGAYMLCINQQIKDQLGLKTRDSQEGILANGERHVFDIAGPVEIQIFNRRMVTDAVVLPGDAEPLLGSIPLEGMDLIVDPREMQLKLPPDRPYIAQTLLL